MTVPLDDLGNVSETRPHLDNQGKTWNESLRQAIEEMFRVSGAALATTWIII